jgi:hypothetical protein
VFDNAISRMQKALSETPHAPYEQALVDLGLYAGASESLSRSKADAAPDGAWLFGEISWITWEAKSEAKPEGELGADDTLEAGGHLRYVSRKRDQEPPGDSFGFIIAPQQRTHPAAAAIAEEHLWLLRTEQVLDLHHKIARTWRRLRTLSDVTPQVAGDALHAEQALPTQWIPDLKTHRVMDEHRDA